MTDSPSPTPYDDSASELEERDSSPNREAPEGELKVVSEPARPVLDREPLRIGPGFVETAGWVLGFFAVQMLLGIVLTMVAVMFMAAVNANGGPSEDTQGVEQYLKSAQGFVVAASQFATIFITIGAVYWRWGRHFATSLRMNRLRFIHLLAILALMLPTQVLSQAIYEQANSVWQILAEQSPLLQMIDKMGINIVESAPNMIKGMAIPTVLLIFVIAPAVSEELLFRGIIGNGLLNRYGVMPGMLVTSMVFAIVHMHPIHATAVFALGAVIHWVYLTTRSIWGPILLHFCNNGFAMFATLYLGAGEAESEGSISPLLTLCSFGTILLLCTFLWQSRSHMTTRDGKPVPFQDEWRFRPSVFTKDRITHRRPSIAISLAALLATLSTLVLIFSESAPS